jgi:uncharacterized protein YpiB (UPF0302 family)
MVDAPEEVIQLARAIARQTKKTLRQAIDETMPGMDEATLTDLTDGICQMMAKAE